MKENKENSSPSVTLANLDHTKPCWYWDKKDLAHTPSQLEGLDPATEARYRREGARFIFDVGTRLGLHYDTLATGIIYFHRFYMFHSFKQFPRYVTGACCLFLAGKVEETPKKCKDIIKTARSLLNDVQFGQFGDDPKEEVMVLERILLQTIKFDLQVEHPYQFLLKYAKQLKGDKNKIQKLVQMAWTFVNDSLCTTLSLQWEPEIIAVAVMYLAGRLCKFEIQEWTSKPMYRRWWEQFVQDVPVDVLEDICHQILDLYSQGKQQMPHHTPHQLQQPPSLQPTSQGPPAPQLQPSQSSEQSQPQQSKDSQQGGTQQQQQPQQQQQQPQIQQPKKPSPQSSPPRQTKRPVAVSPKEEAKPAEVPPKIAKIETAHPPVPSVHPPPEHKPPLTSTVSIGTDQVTAVDSVDITKVQIAPPSHPAPVHQPPPMPHRPPPPPPPSSYITGMSTTNSYMSGEGYQSLQSIMKTEAPTYGALPPSYGPPTHLPYHHVYPPNPPPPVPPPPPTSFPPPSIPPPTPGYPPPPTYNPNFPPPRLPPSHAVPPHPPPGLGMPPASYPPPTVPPGGQPPVPPPIPPPGMPPVGGLGRATWMR
ncbi:cyclin-K isoform X4 [Thamnophis elegans]|uniref:cyclin-K isoform X4 n=1 Tax=Thamnophis elegans TaxID=35005 RepID=UPI001377062D|nr:cyclin-K isoform X4 [Thamnophis elegans]